MEQYSQLPQFLGTRKLALWTVILFGFVMALDAATIAIDATQLSLASTYPETVASALSDDDADFTEMPGGMAQLAVTLLTVGIAILYFLGFVATVIVFLIWMRRSYLNLKALGVRGLEYSPGWAVGAWFVPFVNLVRPFKIMKEIWTTSNPDGLDLQDAPLMSTMRQAAESTPLLTMWWAFWIIDNAVANGYFRLSFRTNTPEGELGLVWLDIASSALGLIAAFLAIKVVRAITARQEERHERIVARQTPTFDPPPAAARAAATP